MPIGSIYRIDKIVLAAGQELHAAGSNKIEHGIKSLIERAAGEVWPNFVANQEQKPQAQITTKQLDVLLSNVPLNGAQLTNVAFYLKQATATGNASRSSTVHEKAVAALACAYWTTITLRHNQPSEAQVIVVPVYDGTHDPFVFTGSIALPGSSLVASGYWGAGPVEVNGVLVPGTQEITIESGIKLQQLGDGSEEFDTFVGVETGEASITVKTLQEVNWMTLGLRGVVLDGTNGIVCFGRKFAAGGSRVANATAQHLKFQALNGMAVPMDKDGKEAAAVSDTLKVVLADPASAVPLSINTASAIT